MLSYKEAQIKIYQALNSLFLHSDILSARKVNSKLKSVGIDPSFHRQLINEIKEEMNLKYCDKYGRIDFSEKPMHITKK